MLDVFALRRDLICPRGVRRPCYDSKTWQTSVATNTRAPGLDGNALLARRPSAPRSWVEFPLQIVSPRRSDVNSHAIISALSHLFRAYTRFCASGRTCVSRASESCSRGSRLTCTHVRDIRVTTFIRFSNRLKSCDSRILFEKLLFDVSDSTSALCRVSATRTFLLEK